MFDQEWWHHTYESSLHIYISVYSSKICSSYPTFWCKELSKKRVTTLTPWFRVSCWALPRPPRPYPASKSSGSWIQRLADVLLRSTFPMIDGSKSFKVTMFRLIAFSAPMWSSSKSDLSWNPNFYWKINRHFGVQVPVVPFFPWQNPGIRAFLPLSRCLWSFLRRGHSSEVRGRVIFGSIATRNCFRNRQKPGKTAWFDQWGKRWVNGRVDGDVTDVTIIQ